VPTAERTAAVFAEARPDQPLNRLQFVRICARLLMDTPEDQIELGVATQLALMQNYQSRLQKHYLSIADHIDSWAKIVFPSAFVLVQLTLFGFEMCDNYGEGAANQCPADRSLVASATIVSPMFDGWTSSFRLAPWALAFLVTFPIILGLCMAVRCVWVHHPKVLRWREERAHNKEWRRLLKAAEKAEQCTVSDRQRSTSELMANMCSIIEPPVSPRPPSIPERGRAASASSADL
jgi:hypothetical protein